MSDRFKTVYSKGNNFVIDNSNNRIGINKSSPEEALDVLGNIKATDIISNNLSTNNLSVNNDIILDGAIKNKNDTIYESKLVNALETHKFSTTTGNDRNDFFGTSVAFSGNYAIIGGYNSIDTYKGFAYVYEYNDSTWTQKQILTISDAGDRDMLGSSVAINGNYAFIGAEGHYNNSRKGCVYIFENIGLVWEQIQKLEASDGAEDDYFGGSIATNGNYAIVGCRSNNNGAAYVFELNGTTWTEKQKLLPSNGQSAVSMGYSLAMNSNYAVIGAPYTGDNNTGSVYIFKLDQNGDWGTSVAGETYRNETVEITNIEGTSHDYSYYSFGHDVSISDNNYIIIGAASYDDDYFPKSGAAYIFRLDGEIWLYDQKLEPSQKFREDYFGHSVLINDKLAVIGSRGNNNSTGSVYIFENEGNTWTEKQKIRASDEVVSNRFGWDLALNDESLIVAARGENVRGSVYVYKIYDSEIITYNFNARNDVSIGNDITVGNKLNVSKDVSVGNDFILDGVLKNTNDVIYKRKFITPIEINKLIASDGVANDNFGISVAIWGNYAIVGAYGINNYRGNAYIFETDGTTWTQKQKLQASDWSTGDNFGFSVAINDKYAIVGAKGTDDKGSDSGSVYSFERNANGYWGTPMSNQSYWVHTQQLLASHGDSNDNFGCSVALDSDYVIIGADGDDSNKGAAYIFQHNGSNWIQKQKLIALDGVADNNFANSVAITRNYAIIGSKGDNSNVGSTYIFQLNENIWTQKQKLVSSDGASDDEFGSSVSISGNYVIIGANGSDNNTGSVYIFHSNGSKWTQKQKLVASDGEGGDNFGFSVAINDKYAIVGAKNADSNKGSSYIFEYNGTTWTQKQKLVASDGEGGDNFCNSIAMNLNYVIIGGYGSDSFKGSAYVFKIFDSEINTYDLIVNNNVGIGINDPSEKLEIKGGIKIENALQDSAGTIRYTSANGFEGYHENQWSSLAGGGSDDSGGSGNGVSLVPTTAQTSDLSGNISYPNAHSGTGTEGDIIYDVSKNKFYEASNSKEDGQSGGEVKFRELGYSFFSEHMEGQPPAPSFFFFQ